MTSNADENLAAQPPAGQILIYEDGGLDLQVRLDGQTVWLTQAGMAELLQTTPQNITMHLATIYEDGELDEAATCKEFLQVRMEGQRTVRRNTNWNGEELEALNRIVTAYLEFAELQALSKRSMHMNDWIAG